MSLLGPTTDIETVAGRNAQARCHNSGLEINYSRKSTPIGSWSCQKSRKHISFDVMGLLTQHNTRWTSIELSRKSNCLLAGRPSGFGFLHPHGQSQSYRRFQAWQGSHRRNPGTGRILRRGSTDWDTTALGYNHRNVDMRDHTVGEEDLVRLLHREPGVCRLFSRPIF